MKKLIHLILKEEIQKVLDYNRGILFEFAIPRKTYKKRIDDLIPQILENWCLVHFCTIVGQTQYKKHWSDELRGHLLTVSRLSIKGNDSDESRNNVLEEIWDENDYANPMFLNMTVINKFIQEKIDTKTDIYGQVIEDCINDRQHIFNAILSRNIDTINEYVETI